MLARDPVAVVVTGVYFTGIAQVVHEPVAGRTSQTNVEKL